MQMGFAHEASGTGTDQEMLDSIRAAIVRIAVNGQSYRTADGEVWNGANLSTLRELEQEYQQRVSAAAGGLAYNLVEMQRRS